MLAIENEKQNRMFFLDAQLTNEDKRFTTSVYYKGTFSGVPTHFDSFLPSIYPISLVLFTYSLIEASEYVQVGLNYTLNWFV